MYHLSNIPIAIILSIPEAFSLANDKPFTLNKTDSFSLNDSSSQNQRTSASVGAGIELLMNDKMKSDSKKSASSDIDINDLNELEDELKGL